MRFALPSSYHRLATSRHVNAHRHARRRHHARHRDHRFVDWWRFNGVNARRMEWYVVGMLAIAAAGLHDINGERWYRSRSMAPDAISIVNYDASLPLSP